MTSKYAPLWNYIGKLDQEDFFLSFEQIKQILGFEIDHSFLNYKKELPDYGYSVSKISLKNKTVKFSKIESK
ncbi:hypothetical protein [Oenococcus oeni]|uniref:Uncharacterized protein n=13 Tax=Oenococcus oeni TaxID=1247 RepID=A0A483BCJ3_OENOE|nr:hypothetical protein [Oenococcus oeni]EAV39972.1 hypothetical protein OENOO_35009 [Oenococcus oeni ATCC BAA-1163]KGO16974.1 hypothetical protein OA32_02415 [Oenococcus oeni X2L]AVI94021.1 hypothetical protein AX764_03875 [Oenococcus oeni]AWW99633.1 hypothetical protein C5H79_09285 [Oenococcus oeni]EFD88639.1 hypothetical protein AWRIB429_0839 [Oenococcus oeni AWRIB429]